jgi:acyl-CoA thioesterase-1
VAQEAVLPLGYGPHKLVYPIASVAEVRDYSTGTVYQAGRDFTVQDGAILFRAGTIPVVTTTWARQPDPTSSVPGGLPGLDGKPIRFSPFGYHENLLAVTYYPATAKAQYPSAGLWHMPSPRITTWGDSITAGADASGVNLNKYPFQKGYVDLVCQQIACSSVYRAAQGGKTSQWGADSIAIALAQPSDVFIIGFGMNDASSGITKDQFRSNIEKMVVAARNQSPMTAIVLISGMRHNPDWKSGAMFDQYRDAMREVAARHHNVGVADVTAAYDANVARKGYYSITGNGINHPNDYFHRIQADVILAALR